MSRNFLLKAGVIRWLSFHLWTKWMWVRILLLSLKLQVWRLLRAWSSLIFRQTAWCGFTLKLVGGMIITYSQMQCTDMYSKHSSIIWLVWLNGWVFLYELSGCGFKSCCCWLTLMDIWFVIRAVIFFWLLVQIAPYLAARGIRKKIQRHYNNKNF